MSQFGFMLLYRGEACGYNQSLIAAAGQVSQVLGNWKKT